MYDVEKITKIIADLERYFASLDKFKVESPVMADERFYSLSMVLFAILNRAIDLGEEIVRAEKFGMPGSYQGIFQVLERQKVISAELSQTLQHLTKQRNVLAHEYFDVTEQSIFTISLKMKAVKELMKIAKERIKLKKKNEKRYLFSDLKRRAGLAKEQGELIDLKASRKVPTLSFIHNGYAARRKASVGEPSGPPARRFS